MLEAAKTIASAYMSYEAEQASQAALARLASTLDGAVNLIKQSYREILDAIIAVRGDEIRGRLDSIIDDFRILHRLSPTARALLRDRCSVLTGEIGALASNRVNYNRGIYPYLFLSMLTTLAPIHAFLNRSSGVPEVKYIFRRSYELCHEFTKRPIDPSGNGCGDYGIWCDPGFRADRGDVNEQFRTWLDTNLHPLTRLLIEGHWEMKGGQYPNPWYPSINGQPIPSVDTGGNLGRNMTELNSFLSANVYFKELEELDTKFRDIHNRLPRLETEAEPLEVTEVQGPPLDDTSYLRSSLAGYPRAGLLGDKRTNKQMPLKSEESQKNSTEKDKQTKNIVPPGKSKL